MGKIEWYIRHSIAIAIFVLLPIVYFVLFRHFIHSITDLPSHVYSAIDIILILPCIVWCGALVESILEGIFHYKHYPDMIKGGKISKYSSN